MLVIGLTGGIASGKSTVSSVLTSHHIPIVDADLLARQVVLPGTPAYKQIVAFFGQEVILPDGAINRPKLGEIIFNDDAKRRKLNSIVHPAVRKAMVWEVTKCWFRGEKLCVVDVPLLVEAGLYKFVGKVVVVYCSREIQLQRLMSRDGSNRDAALSRLNSQLPLSSKLDYADHVLDNSGSLQDLEAQVNKLVARLDRDASWTWRLSWLFPPAGLFLGGLKLALRALKRSKAKKRKRSTAGNGSKESTEMSSRSRL